MEPQEVPPLVYQLLFLCDQSDYLVPLQHLSSYFQDKLARCGAAAPANPANCSQRDAMEIDQDRIGN